jgi:4'-phosphopantetheinyl transferase
MLGSKRALQYYSTKMVPLSAMQLRNSTLNKTHSCKLGRIDVWLLSARIETEQRKFYEGVLSEDERERARRFHFQADRDRFVVGRGALRLILSSHCEKDPRKLMIETGSYGKPSLVEPAYRLQFNVAHAGDCVLIGVTEDVKCGVDIEQSHPRFSETEIADRYFRPHEVEWMNQVEFGFTRLWTMKEAIMKAIGRGLSIPLNDIDVMDVAAGRTSRVRLQTQGLEWVLWLKELDLVAGYATSIAAVGAEQTVHLIA